MDLMPGLRGRLLLFNGVDMLTDRRALLDAEIGKLKQSCADLYLKIAIQGQAALASEYDQMTSKLSARTSELSKVKSLIEAGHRG